MIEVQSELQEIHKLIAFKLRKSFFNFTTSDRSNGRWNDVFRAANPNISTEKLRRSRPRKHQYNVSRKHRRTWKKGIRITFQWHQNERWYSHMGTALARRLCESSSAWKTETEASPDSIARRIINSHPETHAAASH